MALSTNFEAMNLEDNPSITTGSSKIHGTGVFATHDLPPNNLIWKEKPIGSSIEVVDELERRTTHEAANFFRMDFDDKWEDIFEMFLKFSDMFTGMPFRSFKEHIMNENLDTPMILFKGIMRSMLPYKGEAMTKRGRLYEIGRTLNHSCQPNAEALFSDTSKSLMVKTLRQINAGDEITIAYVDTRTREIKRSERLGFTCRCSKCVAERRFYNDVFVFRKRYEQGNDVNDVFTFKGNQASDISHDEAAANLFHLQTQYSLLDYPGEDHEEIILALDTIASIYASWGVDRNKEDKEEKEESVDFSKLALAMREKELAMTKRLLGDKHARVGKMKQRMKKLKRG